MEALCFSESPRTWFAAGFFALDLSETGFFHWRESHWGGADGFKKTLPDRGGVR